MTPTNTKRRSQRARPDAADDFLATRAAKDRAEVRYRQARAELAELELAVERGEYHNADECQRAWGSHVQVVKRKLLNFGREMAPHLAGLDARQVASMIDTRVRELMGELSEGR